MRTRTSQSGFTLIELMVAMVCTLLVSGAIYGLMASGQGAFRREPEVTDMQQNLRLAMETIGRDVEIAGQGLAADPTHPVAMFTQVFGRNLDNFAADPTRPTDAANHTDRLSLMVSDSACGAEPVCGYDNSNGNGGNASHMVTVNATTCVQAGSTPVILMDDGTWSIRYANSADSNKNNTGKGSCDNQSHGDISFNHGQDPTNQLNTPSGACIPNGYGTANDPCNPVAIIDADIITYRINTGADGIPNLERSSAGGWAAGGAQWQVIARGIEDMQVEYAQAVNPTTFVGGAPAVDAIGKDYRTLITQVRVTLSGRTTNQQNLTGATDNSAGQNRAIRSSLTSTIAVRTALLSVSRQYVVQSPAPSPMPTPIWN